jgi:hypothetical protein
MRSGWSVTTVVGMSVIGNEPPPARATSGTAATIYAPPQRSRIRAVSDRARSRTVSLGVVSIWSVGICSTAFSGSR